MLKLGLIREYKKPADRRVAFTPAQCVDIQNLFPNTGVIAELSSDRIFTDDQYRRAGIETSAYIENCHILFGIKEVPEEHLLPNKTYLFFSHTIKKQPHNRDMLKAILKKHITLIDYECLVWPNGMRVLGFGRYAGLVGTYEAFKAWGIKTGAYSLKPCYQCADYEEMKSVLLSVQSRIRSDKNKIVLAGSGRVIAGCLEILEHLKIPRVTPSQFLNDTFDETVYIALDTFELYERIDSEPWDHDHFFKNHDQYRSIFASYTMAADIMINGVFWAPAMPRHFSKEDTANPGFKLKLVADISCDIEGSIPITLHDTYPEDPVFGWDPLTQSECDPYTANSIDVLAVSNLPSELPADASEGFGNDLIQTVLPELLNPQSLMIDNATICKNGKLTDRFVYLSEYVK